MMRCFEIGLDCFVPRNDARRSSGLLHSVRNDARRSSGLLRFARNDGQPLCVIARRHDEAI